MQEEAYLLTTKGSPLPDGEQIEKLLTFFGITVHSATADEFVARTASESKEARSCRLFCSATSLRHLLQTGGSLQRLQSVFVQPGGESTSELLALLTNGVGIPVREIGVKTSAWRIADAADGFCGAMSGLNVIPSKRAERARLVADLSGSSAVPIISAEGETIFFRVDWKGIPIFICLAEQVIDLDEELTTPNFDIRDHFFSAVPIVLYLRWAFTATSWRPPEAGACLVIDDPLLKPRYGFVRFRPLVALMERYNFSTSIAFIPWNWRRSDPGTVRLFKENPTRLSFCVHGCDHTAAEWQTDDVHELHAMIALATERMAAHDGRTGLAHDRIMVFPQGVFSPDAMRELKRANFPAVVNTEVKSVAPSGATIRISDVWDVAVRKYSDLPLYTRRYPEQGVENFAFDILLGKLCLIVIHHNFCRDNGAHLIAFIERVNALKVPLSWRSLQEVVRRSYRRREVTAASDEIEMYGGEMLIENRAAGPKLFRIKRHETAPETIAEIRAGAHLVPWSAAGEYLHFELTLPPGESTLVSVRSIPTEHQGRNGRSQSHLKIGLRRYLSEIRDNYVAPAKARLAGSSRLP